jgi:hypothetical protein
MVVSFSFFLIARHNPQRSLVFLELRVAAIVIWILLMVDNLFVVYINILTACFIPAIRN